MTRLHQIAAGALATAALLATSACGTLTVSGDDLSKQVSSQLAAKVGQQPDKVTCPDLKAEKGEKVTCKLTAGGQTYDTAVTVTSVQGKDVKFGIQVANQSS